ncbi:hypothetical protein [Weissella confusa]|uniref:hypothetical protein n=1 Tax=Weissella confusa TaxID=1583 RepID=UPI0018F17738|nr:hypothetical protein [Weissella confusa]MBJ7659833.1 hypothetical protein [Weissella confusa]
MSNRLQRSKFVYFVSIFVGTLGFLLSPDVSDFAHYTDFLNALLTLSGFATTVLFASYSLLPQFSRQLKGLKVPDKFRDRLLVTTIAFALLSVLLVMGMLFGTKANHDIFAGYFALLVGIVTFAIGQMVIIFNILLKMNGKL